MNKNIKRTVAVLGAAVVLASGFTGCKSGSSGTGDSGMGVVDQEELKQSLSYKVENIPMPAGASGYGMVRENNGVYYTVYGAFKEGEATYKIHVVAFDATGNKYDTVVYEAGETASAEPARDFCLNDDGTLITMYNVATYDEATGASDTVRKLVTVAPDGTVSSDADVTAAFPKDEYIGGMVTDKNGNVIVSVGNDMAVSLAPDGTKNYEAKVDGITQETYGGTIIKTAKGDPALVFNEYTEMTSSTVIYTLDVDQQKFKEGLKIGTSASNVHSGSGDYLVYMDSDTGIKGYKEDGTVENIVNLLNLGVDNTLTSSVSVSKDGSFIVTSYDFMSVDDGSVISRISPVDPSQIKEKKAITLGCFTVPWLLKPRISAFNKQSEEYVIVTNSYADTADLSDHTAAVTNFNNELLAGSVPDMVLLNYEMPVDSYISKGLFPDIYPLLDNDPALSRDDLMANVLKAGEKGGKLYSLPSSFEANTFCGKTSLLGTDTNLTISEANNIVSGMGEGAKVFQNIPREEALTYGLMFSNFIDYENGTCDFDNDAFKAFLNFTKEFPEKLDSFDYDSPEYTEREMAFRNNKTLLNFVNFYSFSSYGWNVAGTFGEPVTFVNFPTDNAVSNVVLDLHDPIAISEKSANKEGAWEFVKFTLEGTLMESQESYYTDKGEEIKLDEVHHYALNGLPVLKKDFDMLVEEAKIPNHYYDSNGNKVFEPQTTYVGSTEVKIPDPTEEEINGLVDLITGSSTAVKSNLQIETIIKDEVAGFYQGSKSVDEVAANIQSRVSIYMSEQY